MATPWWQDVYPVVEAARAAHGIEIVVLRLLDTERPVPHGGGVTYLAEVDVPLPDAASVITQPADVELDEQPLRLPYAKPGGPAADLAWADEALGDAGLDRARDRPRQVRTWNLSSIWELPLAGDRRAAHRPGSRSSRRSSPTRARCSALLRRRPVPRLLAADGPRVLLADIPGDDRYDADPAELLRMVFRLVHLQAAWIGRESRAARDRHARLALARPLGARSSTLSSGEGPTLDAADRRTLDRFVATLPDRIAAIDDAGLPDTFVHGDFHPGNVRGDPGRADDPGLGRLRPRQPAARPCRRSWSACRPGSSPGPRAWLAAWGGGRADPTRRARRPWSSPSPPPARR